jgi:predicted homoserine dehydrogenase-like protein
MKTNVFSYAKRDLKMGEKLDGRGGVNCYGLIENMEDTIDNPGLPILISNNLKLKRDIRKDERIGLNDVEYDPKEKAFNLYFEASGIYVAATHQREARPVDETYQFV